MPKLVVLNEGLTGQSYELKVDKTAVGRVEDNAFQIAVASVSSHHCEILLRGEDVVVKDLNSTNGTFINNQQITGEAVLKSGEVLRLGQVEMRLETGAPGAAPAPPPSPKPAATPPKPRMESTLVIPKGVSLEQLEQGPQSGFDTSKGGFSKKKNSTKLYFIIGITLLAVVLGVLFIIALNQANQGGAGGAGHMVP
jgi:predicted component of type VI protein secretion system